ncbi:methylated-DNA--[protein]-cysteine S-methyltransferase [Oerskovia rustica]|uniref:Methylated-DNA--protein-cysteine methyltransferase n=1 Tax=Oerskovia rustica TaxID=2762237 RepID=A0ABR8RSM2_9CELL|nr:methylated-DNA--[protein]-cysteine S-methyltransferase [Oerskovia rustica]MBD7950637.1 methylated-DNA--[protein]-cysteine S-methyltransferase [Oerskovia rustica]
MGHHDEQATTRTGGTAVSDLLDRPEDPGTPETPAERTVRHAVFDSPVGELTAVGTADGLRALYFDAHRRRPTGETFGERDDDAFEEVRVQVGEYFAGTRRDFDLDLAPVGDGFQKKVWALLAQIPYGETRSYGDLALALGDRNLARAVGAANGQNPLSIVVPCHRVVGADGSLTGYAGGLERKRFLLALEESDETRASRLF